MSSNNSIDEIIEQLKNAVAEGNANKIKNTKAEIKPRHTGVCLGFYNRSSSKV